MVPNKAHANACSISLHDEDMNAASRCTVSVSGAAFPSQQPPNRCYVCIPSDANTLLFTIAALLIDGYPVAFTDDTLIAEPFGTCAVSLSPIG